MSRATVAAVIPHWNRLGLLETLLENLRHQNRPFDEIIVVDNGSSDGSADFAAQAGARVLRLERNFGFAAAVNRGIEACHADWVAILNNDVSLASDWLGVLLSAAESQNAWFATGKLVRTHDPLIIDGTFDEISRGACACRCGAGKPDSAPWNYPRRIRFAPMTAAIFRRRLFKEVGPLDETFESYLEDIDFGLRCAAAGREGVYVPAAVGRHRGSSTLGEWNSDTVRYLSRNQVLLAAKYFQAENWWPVLAGQLLWGVLSLRHGRGLSYVRGKISGLWAARGLPSKHRRNSLELRKLRPLIAASERAIFELQKQTGSDWYWRAYFWLLRR